MTKQCKLEQSSLPVLRFSVQISVLAEVGKALQRHLLPFKLFVVSQLHSAFAKWLSHSSNQICCLKRDKSNSHYPFS